MRESWLDFGVRVLSARLVQSEQPAVELLVAGATLGPAPMLDLIRIHHDRIDDRLDTLDDVLVPGLARITDDSGALLLRLLGRHAESASVDALQAELTAGLQEYSILLAEEADAGAFEALFATLVTSGDAGSHEQT